MAETEKIELDQLEAGYRFPASSYRLDAAKVSAYLGAAEDASNLYRDSRLVPPMAVAAYAMAALSQRIALPPGTLHVSQELEFTDTVSVDDSLTSQATVSRKQQRGKIHLLAIDLDVRNQNEQAVLSGKSAFLLPEQDDGR